MLTAERLRELLHYDPETGIFTWRVNCRRARAGNIAGRSSGRYLQVMMDYQAHLNHRLAWLYMTGEWPPIFIDHIDRNGVNNKWANLRLADDSQNQANRPAPKSNTSGMKGVYKFAPTRNLAKKYYSTIIVRGRKYFLGCFFTGQEAEAAYQAAAVKYFGEFARVA